MNTNEIIDEISVATRYEFTDKQRQRIYYRLREISPAAASSVLSAIETMPNLPRNVYGLVLQEIQTARENSRKSVYGKEDWRVSDGDRATPEEFSLTMECIGLLCKFEGSCDLLVSFSQYLEKAWKKDCMLETLQKARDFYREKIKEGAKLKPNNQIQGVLQ